jgi:hypothetical protein
MTSHQTNADLDQQVLEHDARAGARVLDAVYAFLGRFVSYPSEHTHIAHALWIVHTHVMEKWESTPRLAFLSPEPASGKTRALEITELLVPNPVATVNVTSAYLFRKVGGDDPATILFDEIDTVFGPKAKENEDIRGLLNAGHRRGATTGRCVVHGRNVTTEEWPAYAAVAVAGLGWLPDTLLSRSIVIRMQRRRANDRVEPYRRRLFEAEGWALRDRIAAWASGAGSSVTWPELPEQITDRNADIWEPLVAIADAVGGDWPERARVAAVALVADLRDAEPSLGIKLLADLRVVFAGYADLPTKKVLEQLHALEESPWADIRGKPLDERGLAYRLRQYSIRSKTIRYGQLTPKGYAAADFDEAWSRYLPSPAGSATSATSATAPADWSSIKADASLGYSRVPAGRSGVADVADVADLQGHGGAVSERRR